jgi:(E)-4-hydroxy-3-methylbut-2-enyl-diphosphate synthase
VSLTEDPVKEVPVAFALARQAQDRWRADHSRFREGASGLIGLNADVGWTDDPYHYARRSTHAVPLGEEIVGDKAPVRVELEWDASRIDPVAFAAGLATTHGLSPDLACESVRISVGDPERMDAARELSKELSGLSVSVPVVVETSPDFVEAVPETVSRVALVVDSDATILAAAARRIAARGQEVEWSLCGLPDAVAAQVEIALDAAEEAGLSSWMICLESPRTTHAVRAVVMRLRERGANRCPLWLRHRRIAEDSEAALLDAAVDLGSSLCDGLGDGISLAGFDDPAAALDLAYRILQGARQRTTRTEYISCPSCGRTLFDLEETTARVKARTEHLKGVKIAVMGCIVNGPGEMADADFGYVGSGPGRVNLYVGHEVVARGVEEDEAPSRLEELIREHGSWTDPTGSSKA